MGFEEFDKKINMDDLRKEIDEASKNNDFPEVPKGNYVVELTQLELGLTAKDKRPMVKGRFKIKEGKFAKQYLFYNRVIYGTKNDANMILSVLGFLKKLEPTDEVGDIEFKSYSQFEDLLLNIAEDCAECMEYEVKYDPDSFNAISITSATELQ